MQNNTHSHVFEPKNAPPFKGLRHLNTMFSRFSRPLNSHCLQGVTSFWTIWVTTVLSLARRIYRPNTNHAVVQTTNPQRCCLKVRLTLFTEAYCCEQTRQWIFWFVITRCVKLHARRNRNLENRSTNLETGIWKWFFYSTNLVSPLVPVWLGLHTFQNI